MPSDTFTSVPFTQTRRNYRRSEPGDINRRPRPGASVAVAAADRLAAVEARLGQVGSMAATMTDSPSIVAGFLDLSQAMEHTRLPRTIAERISLAVQEHLGCRLGLQAHTEAARTVGIDDAEILLARAGTSADPDVAAIVHFGRQVLVAPAWITAADIAELRAMGLRHRDVVDIVALVALNVLTAALNLVAGLEPEAPFKHLIAPTHQKENP